MRQGRTEKFYVKAFKITNSEGKFTKEDFELFQEKFKIIRKLYLRPEVNCDCYINFRTITKEIKRAMHNAGLKADLLKVDYESLDSSVVISGEGINSINLLVFIKPVPQLRGDNFTVLQVKALSYNTNDTFINVEFPEISVLFDKIPEYVNLLEV